MNTGAMKTGFHSSVRHCAEQRLVAGVVDPRPFVVPDDADGRAPGRIGSGEEAAQERGPRQGQNQARLRSVRPQPVERINSRGW